MTGAGNHRREIGRRRRCTLPLLALCALVLTACGSFNGPAPVIDRSYGDRQARAVDEPDGHLVQRGETVYGIAQRYDVSTRALIEQNNLRPPYLLAAGTRLRLPLLQVHTVRRGDTLYAISRRYRVDVTSLARANRLRSPYTLQVGQRLVLPVDAPAGSGPGSRPATQQANAAQSTPSPQTSAGATASGASTSASGVPRPKPAYRPAPPVPQRDAGGFVWPVDGRVLSSFGAKKSGLHNDGLNIAAPVGAPVRAADNGVVAYAGNQIRGFGNMLLIKHSDGLITAYAHADKLLVTRGDVVSRGQVVARVGKSGDIDAPQLHFEVRRGSQAVDPRKFLPS